MNRRPERGTGGAQCIFCLVFPLVALDLGRRREVEASPGREVNEAAGCRDLEHRFVREKNCGGTARMSGCSLRRGAQNLSAGNFNSPMATPVLLPCGDAVPEFGWGWRGFSAGLANPLKEQWTNPMNLWTRDQEEQPNLKLLCKP